MIDKKYWNSVSDNDNIENKFSNPDLMQEPGDFVNDMADKSLLYQTIKNLSPRHKELMINHFGLFGRRPKSLRELAREEKISQNALFRVYKKAVTRMRKEFKRLEYGGQID